MATKHRSQNKGRTIKRLYKRDEILHVRISHQYKQLIEDIKKDFDNPIISQSDIVEMAVRDLAIKNGVIPDWMV